MMSVLKPEKIKDLKIKIPTSMEHSLKGTDYAALFGMSYTVIAISIENATPLALITMKRGGVEVFKVVNLTYFRVAYS